jgi:replicative DNA helicase
MGTLIKRGAGKFDVSMIVNEATQNHVLKDIGGYEYLMSIVGMELTETNIHYYIDKVMDSSTKYQLYIRLNYDMRKIGNEAANEDVTAADMLGTVTRNVMDLSIRSKAVKEATNLADGIDEYIEERKHNPVEYSGLSTGYRLLDKRIDGLVPGTLTVVCARPKDGKSTLLQNIGGHVAYNLIQPVLIVDTEMPFEQWRSRAVAMLSGVPERRVRHGGYTEKEYYNIQQAIKLIKGGKLFHEYMPGYSIDKLAAIYKKYKHVENIGLAIFDYIKSPPGADFKNKKEYQLLGDVTTALKDLAGELNIPFLCANQINRQDDIADSDRILRYADVLMFFKQKEMEELEQGGRPAGTYKLVIKNSRRGGTTPKEGIGYEFIKRTLQINEAEVQLIDYEGREYQEQEEIEYGSSAEPDDEDEIENF